MDPSITGNVAPSSGMSALPATQSSPSGSYIPAKSVESYAPPLDFHADSQGGAMSPVLRNRLAARCLSYTFQRKPSYKDFVGKLNIIYRGC